MKAEIVIISIVCVLAVFWQSSFDGFRQLLGAQLELLPSLMVYAALSGSLGSIAAVALVGGLLMDSLSVSPLGISVVPLLAAGLVLHASREFIMRTEFFAQLILGASVSAGVPVLTVLLLLTLGYAPVVGLGTIWQVLVMAASGALLTPFWFVIFDWLHRMFAYGKSAPASFRPDREIRRGR